MKQINKLFVTFFYTGYLPISGTSASVVAWLMGVSYLQWIDFSNPYELIYHQLIWLGLIVISFFLGVIATNYALIDTFSSSDPSQVVIDEVHGMWLSMMPLFFYQELRDEFWFYAVLSLIFFRIFDILKPWVISKVELMPRGWGVMMDDSLSGVFSVILLLIVAYVKGSLKSGILGL